MYPFIPVGKARRCAGTILISVAMLMWAGVQGCSSMSGPAGRVSVADVPEELRVDGPVIGAVHATGFQVYTWTVDGAGKAGWTLKGPEATFDDGAGFKGTHSAGPTWAAADGSKVVGRKVKERPSPGGDGVPWLLLETVSHGGVGRLADVTFIQRLHTSGGKAPSVDGGKAGDEVRMPYTADYVFYGRGATTRRAG